MPVSYDSSSLLKCSVSMTYLRYVITELVGQTDQPEPAVGTQNADKVNTQEPPVAQKKASKIIQSTSGRDKNGNPGSGNIDSATGEVMTTTEQQATALGIAVVTGSDGITRNAATGQPI